MSDRFKRPTVICSIALHKTCTQEYSRTFSRQEFSADSAPIVIKLCKTSFRVITYESRVADGSITTSETLRKYGATIQYYEKFDRRGVRHVLYATTLRHLIGLINSFSFDCKSDAHKIAAFPRKVRR